MDAKFDAMEARFDAIEARFDRVDSRFDKLETDMDDGFRRVARKMEVLNDSFLEMQADQRYLDRRLEKIEAQENSS
jgi:flagellar capping protein FliD